MLIITARTWAMIDAVGDNFFVIHDCGDIGENGYNQDGDNDDGSGWPPLAFRCWTGKADRGPLSCQSSDRPGSFFYDSRDKFYW